MFILPTGRPALMGILNVTPDSFSDGGLYLGAEAAIDAARRMVDEGADLIDVGGESTRPRAEPVTVDEERKRIIPVITALVAHGIAVSIDTRKPAVAGEALAAGAVVVNDVSGLRNPGMIAVCAQSDCSVCIMHMLGTPETMQEDPTYGNVVLEVRDYLWSQALKAEEAGIERDRIWIDPGIGFGKTVEHNLALLRELRQLAGDGRYAVMVGTSRKSFLGKIASPDGLLLPANERLEATLASQVIAQINGARIIRAHDVKASRRAIEVCARIYG